MTHDINRMKTHWLIACSSWSLGKKPVACEILSTPIVLFRGENGVAALLDRCPHRNAPLSRGKVIGDIIQCPYHGWQFNTHGECKKIPGQCERSPSNQHAVTSFDAIESNGFIWVKLSPSLEERYMPALANSPEYHSVIWESETTGSIINVLENFLDGTHTHFVHQGLIRKEGNRQKVTANITCQNNRVEIKYTGEGKQSGIISKWFEPNRKESYGRFILPFIAEIEYCSSSGTELLITAYLTPVTTTHHKIFAILSIKRGKIPAKLKQWLMTPFFKKALKQDLAILQWQERNIRRFDGEQFVSTELDLIRPYICSLMAGKSKEIRKKTSILL